MASGDDQRAVTDERLLVMDWDNLAAAVERRASGHCIRAQESSASSFSRTWTSDAGMKFEIFVLPQVADAHRFYRPSNRAPVTGLGDGALFDTYHHKLIWHYRNISAVLERGDVDELRPLADAVQAVLTEQPAHPPDQLLARFHLMLDDDPEGPSVALPDEAIRAVAGDTLWLRVDNLQPDDVLLVDQQPRTPDAHGRIKLTIRQVGEFAVSMTTTNPRTLLNAPYGSLRIDCALRRGRAPKTTLSYLLPHADFDGDGIIRHVPATMRHDVSLVYVVELYRRGVLLMHFAGPTMVSAPLPMVVTRKRSLLITADGQPADHESYLQLERDLYGIRGTVVAFERDYRVIPAPPPGQIPKLLGWRALPGMARAAAEVLQRWGVVVPAQCTW